jgi:hypothetical protein
MPSPAGPGPSTQALKSYEDLTGCVFDRERAPREEIELQWLPVPEFPGSYAIWGATGRDQRGHLWFGVSAQNVQPPSAHLIELDPETGIMTDRGNVIAELEKAGKLRPGEGQMKIHSRIVQAEDGWLYFSSFDEQGEKSNGSRLPTWGGHLWRMRLTDYRWEHLLATPEALIAVSSSGRWVYALGYFGHQVYQFDCRTGQIRNTRVGAAGGHISRNFCSDLAGHVYVPRLDEHTPGGPLTTTLVELDENLLEVTATPLENYTQTRDDDSHGITGIQPLADRSIALVTDQGFLYRIFPSRDAPARVEPVGWMHPEGKGYIASLFTSNGTTELTALTSRRTAEGVAWQWLVYDLEQRQATVVPVTLPSKGQAPLNPLLYGSITRDNAGNCYLAGLNANKPMLLRVKRSATIPAAPTE